MDHNRIAEVPQDVLSYLRRLTKLNLRDNEIADLHAEGKRLTKERLTSPFFNWLSSLLHFLRFTPLPSDLHNWSNLVELDLGSNRLSTLPDEIENFKSLEVFRLSYNQLKVRLYYSLSLALVIVVT